MLQSMNFVRRPPSQQHPRLKALQTVSQIILRWPELVGGAVSSGIAPDGTIGKTIRIASARQGNENLRRQLLALSDGLPWIKFSVHRCHSLNRSGVGEQCQENPSTSILTPRVPSTALAASAACFTADPFAQHSHNDSDGCSGQARKHGNSAPFGYNNSWARCSSSSVVRPPGGRRCGSLGRIVVSSVRVRRPWTPHTGRFSRQARRG